MQDIDKFFQTLPDDPTDALELTVSDFLSYFDVDDMTEDQHYGNSKIYLKYYSLIKSLAKRADFIINEINMEQSNGNITDEIFKEISRIKKVLNTQTSTALVESTTSKFDYLLNNKKGLYEFTDGDIKQVQELINKLRNIIMDTEELSEDHRRRILNKLENLQSEMHKKMSNIDRFYGFLVEAAYLSKIIGDNLKPFIDTVGELKRIFGSAQARVLELPATSSFPTIEMKDNEGE